MKNTVKGNSSVRKTNKNKLMLVFVSNYAVGGKKKSRFIKNKERSRLELH